MIDARYPIEQNGRPGWGAAILLERLHWHAQAGLPGWGLSARAGFGAHWTLRACANILSEFPKLDAGGLIKQWRELPLILTPSWVQHWEEQRPWLGLGLHSTQTQDYQSLLDGPTPSQAYQPMENAASMAVWKGWLERASLSAKADLLLQSAQAWRAWARRHPEVARARQIRDAVTSVGQQLGLGAEQSDLWACLEMWWAQMAETMPEIANTLVQLSKHTEGWFFVCAAAMEAKATEVRDLFDALARAGVYRQLPEHMPEEKNQFEPFLKRWREPFWHQAVSGFRTRGRLAWDDGLQALPCDAKPTAHRWIHMQDQYESLIAALKNGALRVLVRGATEDARAFCLDALVEANLAPFQMRRQEGHLIDQVAGAHWACAMESSRALVIPYAAELMDEKHHVQWNSFVRTPLLVFGGMDINPPPGRFDTTIVMSAMPLLSRLALAKEHFADANLALRVARSLRTGGQIMDAGRWCEKSNRWDWPTVRAHQAGRLEPKLTRITQKNGDHLPALADNGRLSRLADHLALAVQQPENFELLGGQAPKGAVLIGPPGTGKTLFARHLARRLEVPLLAPDCATLFEKPEHMVEVFEQARLSAPCVLLLDEADRLIDPNVSPVLPALLSQIDGVDGLEGVIVIAACNHDRATASLTRPGRLSEVVRISLPFEAERKQIWASHLTGRPLSGGLSMEETCTHLAKASSGFSGADIAETLRRAATQVALAGRNSLRLDDVIDRIDEVRWSAPDGRDPVCEKERWRTCVHEAGHAMLAWRWQLDVHRITVRSRDGALGMVQWAAPEGQRTWTRESAFGRLQMLLGGLAAEKAILEDHGLGGGGDLRAAQAWAFESVVASGLGGLGPIGPDNISVWSEALRYRVENLCQHWCQEAFDEAISWLDANKSLVETLASVLRSQCDLSGPSLEPHRRAVQAIAMPLPIPPSEHRPATPPRRSIEQGPSAQVSGTMHQQSTQAEGGTHA